MSVRQIQKSNFWLGFPRTAISWQMTSLGLTLRFHGQPNTLQRRQYTECSFTDAQIIYTETTNSGFHGYYVESRRAKILKYKIHAYVT
jgi:hypothetical protein